MKLSHYIVLTAVALGLAGCRTAAGSITTKKTEETVEKKKLISNKRGIHPSG